MKRFFCLIMASLLLVLPVQNAIMVTKAQAAVSGSINRVYSDKARYNPGDTATITAQISNQTGSNWSGNVTLTISHLDSQVFTTTQAAAISNGQIANINFTWATPVTDFQGYFVKIDAGTLGSGTSALDVSSNFSKYPRYGYLSEFPTAETAQQSTDKINQLAQDYHLNSLQYYDWMWRHDTLFQRTNGVINSTWQDLFNRTISWPAIQNQIAASHNQNMAAMAYAMVYAAREGYTNNGIDPSWGVYEDNAHAGQMNVDFGNNSTYLWMFDPANPKWQNYIFGQYKDAVNTAGFDGIHVDQMGERDTAYDYSGDSIDLSTRFNPFLNAAKTALTNNNPSKNHLAFNIVDGAVNGWAANDVSTKANTDFNYSEIWYKSDSYMQLKNYIDSLRANSNNKATVLAGYMDYNQNIGPRYEAESAGLTGVTTNTNHPGYTGTGFVDGFTSAGKAVTFTVNAPEQGHYSLVFAYGNATGAASTRNLYVDGSLVTTLSFNNQANWDTWAHDIWYQVDLAPGNHTIKLAYDSGNTGAINLDSLTLGTFDDNSIRLADAMMAASGASHIELGDNNQMLAHEYYPNKSKSMRNSLINAMKDHYSFITAYENLLYDSNVQNNDSGSQFIQIANQTLSGNGTANTIWNIDKKTPDYDIIHLINLVGNTDNTWRNSKNTPTSLSNLATKVYVGLNETISNVYVASPDINGGQTQALSFTTSADSNGTYISFTLPSLQYWDMIYMKRTFSAPANNLYEAESGIKTNVTTNTNHAGYTGSGFVDSFASSNKGVSFVVNAASESDYRLRFRYGNGGSNATRDVYVDGNFLTTIQLNNTGSWDTWAYQELTSHLKPGYHTIVIWDNTSNTGAINLDHLVVQPLSQSAAALYMSNWNNMMGIWMASKLNQTEAGTAFGPRLGELHYASDWSTNQIVDYSGFFRDETHSAKYDQIHNFEASGYLDSGGILNSQYLNYNGSTLPVTITRNYATVPNQNFTVVQYNISNNSGSSINWNVLDQVHFNNKNSAVNQSATYDASRNAIFNNMSGSGQYYMAYGALQSATSYQIGNDTDSNLTHTQVAPWYAFDNNGTLPNNGSLSATNIDAAFQNQVTIPANGTATLYYYLAINSSLAAVQADVDTLRGQSGANWFTTTTTSWTNWLNAGKRINTADTGVNTAYDRNLIVIKDTQNPTTGSFPASTNPSGYGYNVWARDSAFTAMSLDASGHYAEAEKYWNWLASLQNTDGSFHTRFDLWTSANTNFVEPEHDAIGTFLLGVWKHIQLTGKTGSDSFVTNIWPALQRSANFTMNNINSTLGLGASDCSIWEQDQEFYTFTQAMNVAGLYAAELVAQLESNASLGDSWNGAAGTILSNIQKSSSASNSGLWNEGGGYYNQADKLNYTSNTLLDSSVNALIAWGAIDGTSSRATSNVTQMLNTISHDGLGVTRYSGDNFYYTSPYSPGGNESGNLEPVWPQMVNYVALTQIYAGNTSDAFSRLQYYAQHSALGYMPPGEAVSWYYHQPILSTTSEPLTASSFVMVSLAYAGQFEGRVVPPQYNAGAYQTINVTTNPSADWAQWSSVPYYVYQYKDPSPSNTHIKNIAISNDVNNIYVRIDNSSGTLPGFNAAPLFAVQVYSEDYNHNVATPSSSTGMNGTLSRPMSYMVGRWSNSANYSRFHYANGSWVSDSNITNVTAPQWDTSTGRIELAIPIANLSSSGAVSADSWANLNIALVVQNAGGQWVQDSLQAIHYRINSSSEPWIYGNVR